MIADSPFAVTENLRRSDRLQAEEMLDAQHVADLATVMLEQPRADRRSIRERHALIYRTVGYLRGLSSAWRTAAKEQATLSVLQTIEDGDVGALFTAMSPEKRRAIARALAIAAVGSYTNFLSSEKGGIAPGVYLRLQEQAREEWK